jgi:hypothetical protein
VRAALFVPVVALGLMVLGGQRAGAPGSGATLTLAYRAASEDGGQSGQIRLAVQVGRTSRATVWEHDCTLGARNDADVPGEAADQYWSFRADAVERAGGPPSVRLRTRLVTARGPGPEAERLLLSDGRDTVQFDALSARATCRYDRLYVTAVAR